MRGPGQYQPFIHLIHISKAPILYNRASQVAQKKTLAKQERQVQSLGWKDPPEKEMATHSSIVPCEIPWTEEPGGLQSVGLHEFDMT